MKATRILALILACLMLCSAFLVSCGGDEKEKGTAPTVTPTVDTEDKSEVYEAEVKNLNGHTFHFLTRDAGASTHLSTHAVYAEEQNGDKVNDAVFSRNAQLEQIYNCKITATASSNPVTDNRDSMISGDYVGDFIMFTVNRAKSLATGGLLVDIATLNNIDLTKAWWDQEGIDAFNLGNKTFFITGDAATLDDRACWLLAFNRDIIAEWGATQPGGFNIYETVKKGEWTVDLMAKIMTETAKDEDGDGVIDKYTSSGDRIAYACEAGTNWMLLAATGVTVSNKSAAGEYSLPDSIKPEVLAAWEALRGVVANPYRYVTDNGAPFRAYGKATFYSCNYGMALRLSSAKVPIGYLPLPKLNKEQKDYLVTCAFSQCGIYMIPSTVENAEVKDWLTNGFTSAAEQCAYFLEAFAYYSRHTVTPAFVDQVLLKQAVFDADSADMIVMALENKVYDPIVSQNFGSINVFSSASTKNTFGAESFGQITSLYAERLEAARTALKEYIDFVNAEALPEE